MTKIYSKKDNSGTLYYYKDEACTILHRENGPACECVNGTKHWYLNGQCHRQDGPALEFSDGAKEWYVHGKRHRIDGPACEYVSGHKAWYLNGKEYSESEFYIAINRKNLILFI